MFIEEEGLRPLTDDVCARVRLYLSASVRWALICKLAIVTPPFEPTRAYIPCSLFGEVDDYLTK